MTKSNELANKKPKKNPLGLTLQAQMSLVEEKHRMEREKNDHQD